VTHVARSEPYRWPYDGAIDGASLALVLAGWDRGWATRAVDGAAAATAACGDLAKAVLRVGGLVVTVAHGGALPIELPAPLDAVEVGAAGTDGFWGGPLEAVLHGSDRTHLLVGGHGLEGPVHSLLRSANDRGFECLLVTDACSALTEDCRDASASMVCMSGGIFGAVGTTAAVLDTLASLDTPLPALPAP
jgi:hypothetical protein